MKYNTRTERCSTVLVKKSNSNIWSSCQRKKSHVARVCTRRARACGMTAVTVCSASGCKFRVANDALETQCLYKAWTPGCAYRHGIWYLRLETGQRHWSCAKPIESVQLCKRIYSKYRRITGASTTFATCPWSKHGIIIHIQQHL